MDERPVVILSMLHTVFGNLHEHLKFFSTRDVTIMWEIRTSIGVCFTCNVALTAWHKIPIPM